MGVRHSQATVYFGLLPVIFFSRACHLRLAHPLRECDSRQYGQTTDGRGAHASEENDRQ